jgi:hypothetical protein
MYIFISLPPMSMSFYCLFFGPCSYSCSWSCSRACSRSCSCLLSRSRLTFHIHVKIHGHVHVDVQVHVHVPAHVHVHTHDYVYMHWALCFFPSSMLFPPLYFSPSVSVLSLSLHNSSLSVSQLYLWSSVSPPLSLSLILFISFFLRLSFYVSSPWSLTLCLFSTFLSTFFSLNSPHFLRFHLLVFCIFLSVSSLLFLHVSFPLSLPLWPPPPISLSLPFISLRLSVLFSCSLFPLSLSLCLWCFVSRLHLFLAVSLPILSPRFSSASPLSIPSVSPYSFSLLSLISPTPISLPLYEIAIIAAITIIASIAFTNGDIHELAILSSKWKSFDNRDTHVQ